MSANPDVLRASELIGSAVGATAARVKIVREKTGWNPEAFAREQIRTLVRRVFFNNGGLQAKQVVFSAAGESLDVRGICQQAGEALALETSTRVAILVREERHKRNIYFPGTQPVVAGASVRLADNLWRVSEFGPCGSTERPGMGQYWVSRLAQLRSEFEFAVIQGPVAGISSEAALLGELADGIVLVLGAGTTRRASARRTKEFLQAESCRILGTVLSERVFPIPDRVYKRL